MKSFFYKLILIIISTIIVYKLTIGEQINSIINQIEFFSTKEGRKESINKVRKEIKRATEKENYLSKEDAVLINNFINKIKNELQKAKN
jgi:predicted PurR-regulated permease PerM